MARTISKVVNDMSPIGNKSLNKYLDKLEQSVIDYKSLRHNSKSLSREDLKAHLIKTQADENKQTVVETNGDSFYIQWKK